jgi:peptide/nickel transport system ATP-binding protein
MEPMLRIAGLSVGFGPPACPIWAVRGVNLDLGSGEILGLVGESGSGKSVTFLAALGLLGGRITRKGTVDFNGVDLLTLDDRELTAVRGRRVAMIFQDPMSSLNPVHTIGRQLVETIVLHRNLTGRAAREEARRLLARVGISDPDTRMRSFPHQLSGGMNQRVMIAMAIAGKPDLLIADEPTTALDVTIQAQILDLLVEIVREEGRSMVLITHDLGVVAETCDRVAVMYAGRVVESGSIERVFAEPQHPYTRALLSCIPKQDCDDPLRPIEGNIPLPTEIGAGCAFAPRCGLTGDCCRSATPSFVDVGGRHGAACFRVSP